MHKKIEAELIGLAHSVLQMKNKDDVHALHKKAQLIYEKLSVLKFVEAYMNTAPNEDETKKEIETILDDSVLGNEPATVEIVKTVEEEVDLVVDEPFEEKETLKQEPIEEIKVAIEEMIEDNNNILQSLQFTLEEEFKDAISSDVATQLFERATKENPVIEAKKENKQRSLNDTLFAHNIQVGLNDRIAFVKYLFDGSQEDFNRVLSQLNSFKLEEEAKTFIQEFVKPDYDWSGKLEYEERLINLIERKFS